MSLWEDCLNNLHPKDFEFHVENHTSSYELPNDENEILNLMNSLLDKDWNIHIYDCFIEMYKRIRSPDLINAVKWEDVIIKVVVGLKEKPLHIKALNMLEITKDIVGPHLKQLCGMICNILTYSLDKEKYLSNVINYFLPRTKIFGVDGINEMIKYFDQYEFILVKLLDYATNCNSLCGPNCTCNTKFYGHMDSDNENVLSFVFERTCKYKRKAISITEREITFVVNFIEKHATLQELGYLKYFASHVFVSGTRFSTFYDLVLIARQKIESSNSEEVRIGLRMYIYLYEVFALKKISTIYTCSAKDLEKDTLPYTLIFRELLSQQLMYKSFSYDLCIEFFEFYQLTGFPYTVELLFGTGYMLGDYNCEDKVRSYVLYELNVKYKNTPIELLKTSQQDACLLLPIIPFPMESIKVIFLKLMSYSIALSKVNFNYRQFFVPYLSLTDFIKHLQTTYLKFQEDETSDNQNLKMVERAIKAAEDALVVTAEKDDPMTSDSYIEVIKALEDGIFSNSRYVSDSSYLLLKRFIKNKTKKTEIKLLRDYLESMISNLDESVIQRSRLRRCSEYRLIVHAIIVSAPKDMTEEFVKVVWDKLSCYFVQTNSEKLQIALYCTIQVLNDATLKRLTKKYVFEVMVLSLKMACHSDYLVVHRYSQIRRLKKDFICYMALVDLKMYHRDLQNIPWSAGNILFRTIVDRIFPSSAPEVNTSLGKLLNNCTGMAQLCNVLASEDISINQTSKLLFLNLFKRTRNYTTIHYERKTSCSSLMVTLLRIILTEEQSSSFVQEVFACLLPQESIHFVFKFVMRTLKSHPLHLTIMQNLLYLGNVFIDMCREYMLYGIVSPHAYSEMNGMMSQFLDSTFTSLKRSYILNNSISAFMCHVPFSFKYYSLEKCAQHFKEMIKSDKNERIKSYSLLYYLTRTVQAKKLYLLVPLMPDIVQFLMCDIHDLDLLDQPIRILVRIIDMNPGLLSDTNIALSDDHKLRDKILASPSYTALATLVVSELKIEISRAVRASIMVQFHTLNDPETAIALKYLGKIIKNDDVTEEIMQSICEVLSLEFKYDAKELLNEILSHEVVASFLECNVEVLEFYEGVVSTLEFRERINQHPDLTIRGLRKCLIRSK